jgi:hypothetical protein
VSEQSNPEDDADRLSKAQIVLIGATYVLPLKLENGTENDHARIAPLAALELARAHRNRSRRRARYAIVFTSPQNKLHQILGGLFLQCDTMLRVQTGYHAN